GSAMVLAIGEATWGSVAGASITAVATVLAAVLGYRANRYGSRRFSGGGSAAEGRDRARLVHANVPAIVYQRPRRWPWRAGMAILLAITVLGAVPFGYSMYAYAASGFEPLWWFVGVVFAAPAAVALGWLIALFQIGFDRAGVHAQRVHVEGTVRTVMDQATEALSRMKIGVRKYEVSEDTGTIDASRVGRADNVYIRLEQLDDTTCEVDVKAESQPGIFSFRKNSRYVAQFLSELTGVRVYPASFIPDGTRRSKGVTWLTSAKAGRRGTSR
ncbi:MAG TPA: hypothetical protein VEV43_12435, partial [Actinomycetota bacterium]|nr:hypothetical protein [Actinomycetota bacterium]